MLRVRGVVGQKYREIVEVRDCGCEVGSVVVTDDDILALYRALCASRRDTQKLGRKMKRRKSGGIFAPTSSCTMAYTYLTDFQRGNGKSRK